jgi:hypothetical protein
VRERRRVAVVEQKVVASLVRVPLSPGDEGPGSDPGGSLGVDLTGGF